MFSIRLGSLRKFACVALVCALLLGAQPTLAQDVNITTPTTVFTDYNVGGQLTVGGAGSLNVLGSLGVDNNITNNGLPAGINVTGRLLAGGDVINQAGRQFAFQGAGTSSITGNLFNYGPFTVGNGAAQLDIYGDLFNGAGADFQFFPNAQMRVLGEIQNAGNVTFQHGSYTNQGITNNAAGGVFTLSFGDFENAAGGMVTNSGTVTLSNGRYINEAATNNQSGGNINLTQGDYRNSGSTNNSGSITLSQGDFWNHAGSTVTNGGNINITAGDFQNQAGGTVTNGGNINLTAGNFWNAAGGTVTNSGTVTLSNGRYINQATTNNQSSGNITVTTGNFYNLDGGTLTNQGTIAVGNGDFLTSGVTNNQSGGNINITTGSFDNFAGGTLTNQGTITLSNGQFFTSGATNNQSGGNITVTRGNFGNFAGGTVTNDGNINVTTGNFGNMAGGTVTNDANINVTTGDFSNGAGGTLTNQGTITLSNGQFFTSGATNNQSGGNINVTTGGFDNFAGGTLTNQGTITLSNGQFFTSGATNNQSGGNINVTTGDFGILSGGTVTNSGNINITTGGFGNLDGGTLTNQGTITLSNGIFLNSGVTNNQSGGNINITTGGFGNLDGEVTNSGNINITMGDFGNLDGGTLTNQGTITLGNGLFLNSGVTNNQSSGNINVTTGDFLNDAGGTLANQGTITLSDGDFVSQTGSTMSGDGLLSVNGTATFYQGSILQGNPTITATLLNLQGIAAPGGVGTVGQMTFDATTHFQGMVLFDLVTPGDPGIGSDLIQITGEHTGTVESGTQFDFQVASTGRNIGDKYEIIRGNIALESRPVVTADTPSNLRVILRTDQDVNGFSDQGIAYYALVVRDASFEQLARNNGGKGNEITFGRYLDQYLPQDDHSIGTTNADLQWIRDTLDLMPAEANVVRALGQMSGEVYAPLATVALQRQFVAYNQFAGRLRESLFQTCDLDQSAPGTTNVSSKNRAWVTGYGFGGSIAGDPNACGYSYGGGGVQLLEGSQTAEHFGYGLLYDFGAFGLSNDFGDKADSAAHSFGGYLTWCRDNDYLMFIGGGGFADYHATRHINIENPDNVIARTARGTAHGGQAAFYGEYGLNVQWENVSLRPYLGLLYMNVLQSAFEETEAGALDLSFQDSTINSFRTLLGSQVDFRCIPMPNAVWTLRGVWMHECINEATAGTLTSRLAAIPDSSFFLVRPTTGTDWFVAGCGVRGEFCSRHLRPFANYDLVINSYQPLHTGLGGIEFVW